MEDSMSSDKGIITTSDLSSSSPSASPSSSSSFSTNYPPPPQVAVISSPSIFSAVPSSSGSSPNSPANTIVVLPPEVISSQSSSRSVLPQSSSSTDSPPAAAAAAVIRPCAACKILRRRCTENCVLAPYFPPRDPVKFTIVHRVFGGSNIIRLLQELPESQRTNAVSSMLYEANVRLRDPVYGCAGAISELQNQVNELRSQLARNATS